MTTFVPFGPDASTTIGGLTIETDATVLTIYGSLDARRDKIGLKNIARLKEILEEAESSLLSDKELPDHLETFNDGLKDNPF